MRRLDLGSGKRELLMRHFLTNKSAGALCRWRELFRSPITRASVRSEGTIHALNLLRRGSSVPEIAAGP
jgi:hypothetical protein